MYEITTEHFTLIDLLTSVIRTGGHQSPPNKASSFLQSKMFCSHLPYFWVALTTEVYMLGFIVGSSLPDNEDDAFNTSRITSNTRNGKILDCT